MVSLRRVKKNDEQCQTGLGIVRALEVPRVYGLVKSTDVVAVTGFVRTLHYLVFMLLSARGDL
jgi:hypothetical protein